MVPTSGLQQLLIERREHLLRFLHMRGAGDDAEDLIQEMWQRAGKGPGGPVADPASYLYRMAENLMRDLHRERAARARREIDWSDRHIEAAPDTARILTARQRLTQVQAALRAIGPRAERILRRYRLDGISQIQIAREEGVSLSTVEKELQKAYRELGNIQKSFNAE